MVEGAPNDGLYQIIPIDEYDNSEGEVTVCSLLVKGSGTIPLLLTNSANKNLRIKRGEELAHAYPVREVDQVRIRNEDRFRIRTEVNELRDEDITVPERYRRRLKGLLRSNREVIAMTIKELGQTKTVEMRIDTGDHPPIKLRPYRTPIHKRKLVEEAVNEMMNSGMIERSKSPWSFPVVIVEKKDGGHRFCMDFRQLNAITKPLVVPLPLIDDILALLGKSKCFSTLDLRSGYWQVALNKEVREKTVFTCHMGLFNFRVMLFGLANAPGVFSQLMSIVLDGMETFTMAYLDDIMVFLRSPEEHFEHLQWVFDRLKRHGLKLKLSKCQFLREETKYLGFVINKDGVKTDVDKVEVILFTNPSARAGYDTRSIFKQSLTSLNSEFSFS